MVDTDALQRWRSRIDQLRRQRAKPDDYLTAWAEIFRDWPVATAGPAPFCLPDSDALQESNLARWMVALGFANYLDFFRWSATHRAEFWQRAIERLEINLASAPSEILDLGEGPTRAKWLPGARLNIVCSCFQGDRRRPAVLFGRTDGTIDRWTLQELEARVKRIASAIRQSGHAPGTPLAVVLPLTAEAVALYLAIIWAGCTAVSIADSFAPAEIANRLRIAQAQAVFTYDVQIRGGKRLPLYERICQATDLPVTVMAQGDSLSLPLRGGDTDWNDFLSAADGELAVHIGEANDAINILFSSGTTGDPKAIPWTHLTPIRSAIDGHCHQDIRPGHICCWPTNLGWMMGPWLIFASLINRGTIALYDDAPMQGGFGKFVEQAAVNMLGVVPTIVKAWRSQRTMEGLDWSAINVFSSTGESSQRDDMMYLSSLAGVRPVIEYCGGTEIGGGFITSTVVQPNVASAFSTPAVGLDFLILDEAQQAVDEGELFLVPPSIGLSSRLLNRNHQETYYEGTPVGNSLPPLRRHGDHFRRLPSGYFVAGGRVDDTMNLGGIKVSSAELERVLNLTPGVRETAAVAINADGGPDELVVFTVGDSNAESEELRSKMNRLLKDELNPLFKVSRVVIVDSLPRTASNKVMRRLLREQIHSIGSPPHSNLSKGP